MGEQAKDDLYAPIVRIVRVARGLEEQLGSYAGRAWWSAAYSQLVRGALEAGIPNGVDSILKEMDGALDSMRQAGADKDLLTALERSRELVERGEKIRWDEFEHVLVCRHCGDATFGERKRPCPNCGAAWITRREFLPIWFLNPLDPPELIDALASTPKALKSAAQGLPEAELRARPQPEEWSLREVFEHLWLAQGLMGDRIDRMLAEESPEFSGVAVATSEAAPETTRALLDDFTARRGAQLAELSELDGTGWERGGRHDEFGDITVQSQASYMARHEGYHLRQVREVRGALTP